MKFSILSRTLLATLAFSAPAAAAAQEITDTVRTQELQEITIEAPKVIRKADMDVYHPSKSAVDNSKNGLQLLSNLMIPMLSVSDVLGSVTAAGQSVQMRINGRAASVDQVKALLPETIKRVEWMDNPGLRYGGANYVLNFIVANPTLGGSLMLEAQPALNAKWGQYTADAKFNSGRSQWSVGGFYKLTEDIKAFREYGETFTYPDGRTLTRTETPTGGLLSNTQYNGSLSYSYIRPDTTVFYAQLGSNGTLSDKWQFEGILSLSDGTPDISLLNSSGSEGNTPNLSLYLEQHLARRQMLVVDFGASFYSGHSFSDYVERLASGNTPINDIHTYIKDFSQAYALEVDYIKRWRASRLTAGATYSANRTRSTYENLGGEIFHQRQDRAYIFAEYMHTIGRLTLTGGIGAQYNSFFLRESGQGRSSWNVRPQATVRYAFNPRHQLQLSFTSWQSSPSLSQTRLAPQQTDGFQWNIGNPDLHTYSSYQLTARYTFSAPRVSGSLRVQGYSSPHAITPYLFWQDNRLITSYENGRGQQSLKLSLSAQVDIVPKWLSAVGSITYTAERSRGAGYKLYNHDWSGNVSVRLTHWGFTLSALYMRAQRSIWGETISSQGEDLNIINIAYNWKSWQFAAGIIMPFGKYDQFSSSLNKWNSNVRHTRLSMRMPFVSVNYNLQWGRQKRGANKLINADASADHSTTSTR